MVSLLIEKTMPKICLLTVLLTVAFVSSFPLNVFALNRKKHDNRYSFLVASVKKYYLKEIPVKYRKFIHFNNFMFSGNFNKQLSGDSSLTVGNPDFAGKHTAVFKWYDGGSGLLAGMGFVSFDVAIRVPVVVAANTLGKYQIIKKSDLKTSFKNLNSLTPGYYVNIKKVAGRETRRVIALGSPVTGVNTERKRIINFGDKVDIIYDGDGLVLRAKGVALQSGAYGAVISVKNNDSGEIVKVTVKSAGVVTVR